MGNKKYYWLKLRENFFDQDDTKLIENMENGKDYIIFLLKLYLKSIKYDGKLLFNGRIPYNDKMLATITKTNIDVVRSALKLFQELNLISLLDDGTLYVEQIKELIGTETDWAEKKRNYREKLKQQEDNVPLLSKNCPSNFEDMSDKRLEIEIDIEKEIDIDNIYTNVENLLPEGNGNCPHQSIMDLFNSICVSLPRITQLTDSRKNILKVWWRKDKLTLDLVSKFFERVEASDFLTNRQGNFKNCSFDWIIKPANRLKIQEGNYDNKEKAAPPPPRPNRPEISRAPDNFTY